MASPGSLRLPIVIEVEGGPLAERLDALEAALASVVQVVQQLAQVVLAQGVTLAASTADIRSAMSDSTDQLQQEFDNLSAQLANNTSVTNSAVVAISEVSARVLDLTQRLEDAGVDPALLTGFRALGDGLRTNSESLATAIAAIPEEGVPVEPTPDNG